jgi:hypothetical protein
MAQRHRLTLISSILLTALLFTACGPGPTQEVSPTLPPAAEPARPSRETGTQGKCGDGVCDQAEQEDTGLCPQDCTTAPTATEVVATEVPATPTPTPVTPTPEQPAPEGEPPMTGDRCGDGVCDEAEQGDPNLCPQDCADSAAPAGDAGPPPGTGSPDYEPPINVYLILHIDPLGGQEADTFKPEQAMYTRTRDEIDWLAGEAARHGLRFTSLYNGWYSQWALNAGDIGQFESLHEAGHEIGSHAHRISYDAASDIWIKRRAEIDLFGRPNYDAAVARQCWDDADRFIDTIVAQIGATGQNRTMCATALTLSDEPNLMDEFGFTIAAGNRLEKGINYFGHIVWNPWRASISEEPGYELAEDRSVGYVTFNHLAQIGGGGAIGMPAEAHGQDLTLGQMQRRFLMLYAEWLARERTGAEDRVWAYGFVYHPNYGDRYNREVSELFDWLDEHFVGKTSPHGHTIAQYATVKDIADEFHVWEAVHPGASSFNYVRGDPYPYTYAAVTTKLEGAAYEAHVDLGQGVSCFRFTKEGQPIYLLWSDLGERTVSLSLELSGQVRVTDATGQESVLDAAALPLTEGPILAEPAG